MRPTIGLRMSGLSMPIARPIVRHNEPYVGLCLLVHHREKWYSTITLTFDMQFLVYANYTANELLVSC